MESNLQGKYKMPKKKVLTLVMVKKIKLGILIMGIITFAVLGAIAVDRIAAWGADNEIVYNQPIKVEFKSPVEVRPRPKVIQLDAVIYEVKPEFYKGLNDTEKKICDTFGLHCREAIAVAKAESGGREDAMNINTNGTVDLGLFQINSIHYKKVGCSLKEVATIDGNIKCAKQIYDASGWNAWVAYNSGAYLKFLK